MVTKRGNLFQADFLISRAFKMTFIITICARVKITLVHSLCERWTCFDFGHIPIAVTVDIRFLFNTFLWWVTVNEWWVIWPVRGQNRRTRGPIKEWGNRERGTRRLGDRKEETFDLESKWEIVERALWVPINSVSLKYFWEKIGISKRSPEKGRNVR